MKRVKVIFINLIVLTATSLLMRTIGIWFQVYLSKKIGPSGIGLFQLILAVYFLAITLATSGIRLAAIRLVAEELGIGNDFGARKALTTCLTYSLIISCATSIALYSSAGYIGTRLLDDTRTILSLRLLALSLPFLAMSSVLSGYFTAVRRAIKAASVQILEQVVRIGACIIFLSIYLPQGLEHACAAIVVAALIGELFSFLILFFLYRWDIRRYSAERTLTDNLNTRIYKIALPIALSAYLTSAFRTIQNLLIPYGLKKSGSSSESALSTYGIINGMVIPILMFPAALLNAVSELIVPELAECMACKRNNRLKYIISRVLNMGIISSICIMSIFFRYSQELGIAIYNSSESAYFIRILAPLIPIMYMDSIVDGMLKGINEQVSSMRYNILESLIGAALIYLLLPKYAITGYIFTIFLTRFINFSLSLNKMLSVIKARINVSLILKAGFCILNAIVITNLIFFGLRVISLDISFSLTANIALLIIIYYILLRLMRCITDEDLLWFLSILK